MIAAIDIKMYGIVREDIYTVTFLTLYDLTCITNGTCRQIHYELYIRYDLSLYQISVVCVTFLFYVLCIWFSFQFFVVKIEPDAFVLLV